MKLFCRCQADHAQVLAETDARLARMESRIRQLEGEAESLHGDVRRWMRRAVAAERVTEREETPAAAAPTPQLTGVRARRMARLLRSDPLRDTEGTNGVHS